MTGIFWLDWAAIAVSLTNTILLIWLGTTVLFNVERRTWGGWLAAAGLLLGGVFFISHTAILGYGFNVIGIGLNLWWAVGLMAVLLLPSVWYVMMLWYSGFWQAPSPGETNTLRQRQTIWLMVTVLLLFTLIVVALLTQPRPPALAYPSRGLSNTVAYRGVPVVLVLYPIYTFLCLVLSLDALRHPGPSHRKMGPLARQKAMPWLIGATVALLLVGLSVAGVFAWLSQYLDHFDDINIHMDVIGYFDLLIASLIALAVMMLGQAVVAYEVFTGQTLPRRGLLRQWQRAILLAIGYGMVIGFTSSTNLRPIYGILLSTLLMTFFFALLSWQTYSERQRTIASLRPFVASQRFYDQLLASSPDEEEEASLQVPFNALCRDVLNTRRAALLPLGPMAPLVGPPLTYPPGQSVDVPHIFQIAAQLTPETIILPVSGQVDGMEWVVPLWSQRGLAGVLFLGDKQDGGIYGQEEIEVAQASGERLIDTKASAEIAQRLMGLQRKRLAESQVVDQRARRTLHDDVLQQLHTAVLKLASQHEPDDGVEEAIQMLTETHRTISNLLHEMPTASLPELHKLGLVGALRKVVSDEFGPVFDTVRWEVEPEAEVIAKKLSAVEAEVVYYAVREAVRNAAKYGRPEGDSTAPLHLTIQVACEDGLWLVVEDDGVGINSDAPGGYSGQGLGLHSTMMAVVGGELTLESEPGVYTRVTLRMPESKHLQN